MEERFRRRGFKYFVVKMEDVFELNENALKSLDYLLMLYNKHRESKGKPINKYWVVNRDKSYANQVKELIEKNEGIKLKEKK